MEGNIAGARGRGGVLSRSGTFLSWSCSSIIWFCRLENVAWAFESVWMS